MTFSDKHINKITRATYHKQHKRVADNKIAMDRFMSMINCEYFGLDEGFFIGKEVLDAGCGSTAKLSIKFSKMGANVTGIDIGKDFISTAKSSAAKNGVKKDKIKFKTANLINLPFENNSFDFVCCHGVLLHLANFEQVEKAFGELARVTKKGGALYTVFGLVGGLLEEAMIPAFRSFYKSNIHFKKLIDNLSPKDFLNAFKNILALSNNRDVELELSEKKLLELFDVDFCVTIQNFTQAPIRLEINEKYIRAQYKKYKFKNIKRLKRFVKRKNIRKYFAPLHYLRDQKISKLLYGSGNLEFIAYK